MSEDLLLLIQGRDVKTNVGVAVKIFMQAMTIKMLSLPFLMFDIFDVKDINAQEKEVGVNVIRFKKYVSSLIDEREKEMKDPNF